jgi:hypothetical protein
MKQAAEEIIKAAQSCGMADTIEQRKLFVRRVAETYLTNLETDNGQNHQ